MGHKLMGLNNFSITCCEAGLLNFKKMDVFKLDVCDEIIVGWDLSNFVDHSMQKVRFTMDCT